MKFVLRHVNIFTRPSSKDGQEEWEEVHDPELRLDIPVAVSCLMFLFVSAFFYFVGDMFGSVLFLIVTLFSTLSDAVFYRHYYLDLIDRITAACGCGYIAFVTTKWFMNHGYDDYAQLFVWVKIASQIGSGALPFYFLDQCRSHPVRSESWRQHHIKWHISGTLCAAYCIFVGHGYADETIETLDPVVNEIVATEPLVRYAAWITGLFFASSFMENDVQK